jgi:hypothetical protein
LFKGAYVDTIGIKPYFHNSLRPTMLLKLSRSPSKVIVNLITFFLSRIPDTFSELSLICQGAKAVSFISIAVMDYGFLTVNVPEAAMPCTTVYRYPIM